MNGIFYGKRRRLYIAIYFVLLFSWLFFIFYNSVSNGEQSTAQSNRILFFVRDLIQSFAPEAMVGSYIIRKTAHFLEFFVLGALYYTGTFFIKSSRISLFLHSLSLSLFTAFVDETVQLFSVGRASQVKDIWIDLSGAFVAHVILFAIYFSYKHFRKK